MPRGGILWDWDTEWERVAIEPTATKVSLVDARLVIECESLRAEGSPSGCFHLLAAVWAVRRGYLLDNIPCLRLLDERTGFMGPNGDLARRRLFEVCFAETLALVDALAGHATFPRDELAMLFDLLLRRGRWVPERAAILAERYDRWEILAPASIDVNATTNLAAIKKLLAAPELRATSAPVRLAAAEFLHARFSDLDRAKGLRLAKLLPEWAHLLEDSNARVREVAWENLDLVVQILLDLDDPAYKTCLGPLRQLVARGIDLDLNLARLCQCANATGGASEAREARARLDRLVGPRVAKQLVKPHAR